MRAHFLRHGESASNAAVDRISLPPETGDRLTELGRQQAARAARHLEGLGVERVLSSDMRRARETAEIVADHLSIPVEVVVDLHEFRDAEGYGELTIEEQRSKRWSIWMAEHADDPEYAPPGAESFAQLRDRAERVKALMLEQPGEAALAIGHGILLRFIFATCVLGDAFTPALVPRLWQLDAVNCGLTTFEHGAADDTTGPAQDPWRCLTWMARPWDPHPPR